MIDFNWITIPGGNFLMGSSRRKGEAVFLDHNAWINEYPQHQVFLPEFRISETPVTTAQYLSFIDATNHTKPWYIRIYEDRGLLASKLEYPITTVSWFDAYAFCNWAEVRLPTEAEWEKAARGVKGQIYPWGNDQPSEILCNFGQGDGGDTTPVKQYPLGKSPFGVYDMCGNVWEWTSTLERDYPYRFRDDRENLSIEGNRIVRGGSMELEANRIRCASRAGLDPSESGYYLGFRVALPRQVKPY